MSWFDDDYEREREESRLATPSEAVAEFGFNAGMDNPDKAWLLHDWDVWVKNPHYVGPPVPHPEEDCYEPWDTDGDTSKWNENGEASEAANDRAFPTEMDDNPGDDFIPF